jgi:4-hydroxybenzoate polyprenyltransferase
MRRAAGTIAAYAELTRISNVPTVWSNVLVGCALGAAPDGFPWRTALGVAVAMSLMYCGGMALNDAVDAKIDRSERPRRPIPSGRVSRRAAIVFTVVCLAGGLGVLAGFGAVAPAWGGALAATIVAYDIVHKRWGAAALLMGACRGLVVVTAAAAAAPTVDWSRAGPLAGAMTAYIVGVTLAARHEAGEPKPMRWPTAVLPAIVIAPALLLRADDWSGGMMGAGAASVAWIVLAALPLVRPPVRVVPAIMAWLAGICLVDAFFLTILDRPLVALVAAGLFVVTALGHRRILGT